LATLGRLFNYKPKLTRTGELFFYKSYFHPTLIPFPVVLCIVQIGLRFHHPISQSNSHINNCILLLKDYDAQDLADFQQTILRGCDFNRDGKVNKKELTMILLALSKQNAD